MSIMVQVHSSIFRSCRGAGAICAVLQHSFDAHYIHEALIIEMRRHYGSPVYAPIIKHGDPPVVMSNSGSLERPDPNYQTFDTC
jgi:hypothetical protein